MADRARGHFVSDDLRALHHLVFWERSPNRIREAIEALATGRCPDPHCDVTDTPHKEWCAWIAAKRFVVTEQDRG